MTPSEQKRHAERLVEHLAREHAARVAEWEKRLKMLEGRRQR